MLGNCLCQVMVRCGLVLTMDWAVIDPARGQTFLSPTGWIIILVSLLALVLILVIFLPDPKELSERDECARYKDTSISNVPIKCIKYYNLGLENYVK